MATKKVIINGKSVRMVSGWLTKVDIYGEPMGPAIRIDIPCLPSKGEKFMIKEFLRKKCKKEVVLWYKDDGADIEGCYFAMFESEMEEPTLPYYCYESEDFVLTQYRRRIPTYTSSTINLDLNSFSNVG